MLLQEQWHFLGYFWAIFRLKTGGNYSGQETGSDIEIVMIDNFPDIKIWEIVTFKSDTEWMSDVTVEESTGPTPDIV